MSDQYPQDYGQIRRRVGFYDGLSPEDQAAMVKAEWLPDRLQDFRHNRDAEEARLQEQISNAQRLAFSPVTVNTASTPAAIAGIVANALRTFGGMALAGRGEKQLADTRADNARQYGGLINEGETGTGVGKRVERNYLSDALRGFGPDAYGGYSP